MRPDDDSADLPAELKEELREMFAPGKGFDAGRDAQILAAARAAGGRRSAWRRWMLSGAVAAVVAVAIGVGLIVQRSASQTAYVRTGDVRDAFYVARELKRGHPLGTGFDENHDGRVDDKDVQLLAMAAVRVDRGGGR